MSAERCTICGLQLKYCPHGNAAHRRREILADTLARLEAEKKFAEILFPQGSERQADAVSTDNEASRNLDAAGVPAREMLSTSPVETALPVSDELRHACVMSHIDGCPECVLNTEPPKRIKITDECFTGYYRCSDCGHSWSTAWRD